MMARAVGVPCFVGMLLAAAGCTARPVRYVRVAPASAQALSFLGDTLWTLPLDPTEGQRRVRLLFRARDQAAERPHNTSLRILLGRRTADLGRFREAIGIYTEAMEADPADLRLPRRRGELLLRIRELDRAVDDLARAARRALERETELEYNDLSGGGFVETTLQYSALFYLGLAHYLKGDFVRAHDLHREALERARNADDVASAVLWAFFSTRRLGRHQEATTLLNSITADMPVALAVPEHQLLLTYRGDLPQDSLPVSFRKPLVTEADAMYGYGIGFALLMLGRHEEAALAFEQVRGSRDWSALPYLAAEAELARMGGQPERTERTERTEPVMRQPRPSNRLPEAL